MDREPRRYGRAQARGRGPRPHGARRCDRSFGVPHTRDYLVAFEEELAKAADSAALKAAMKPAFPDLGMGVALRHRRQGRQGRNEVGLRQMPISI